MQVTTELRDMFNYSFIPPLLLIILLLVVIFYKKKKKIKNNKPVVVTPPLKDRQNIKNKYLHLIDELNNDVNNNKITLRASYQKLSKLIRNFAYEMTNIKVQNYTLTDLYNIDMPILCELVNEYYHPEFAKISRGNILASIAKTKEVIIKWN